MTSKKEQFFRLKRKVSFKRNHHIVFNALISPAIKENVDMRWTSLVSPLETTGRWTQACRAKPQGGAEVGVPTVGSALGTQLGRRSGHSLGPPK